MLQCSMDHLVITAPSLEGGMEYVREVLGVTPQYGGEHPRMGTHNALLKLGEKTYLEVIAPNPNAPQPSRSRWFGLDQMERNTPPRLATWVARTDDIKSTVGASPFPLGEVELMSRGHWDWLITIPPDGSLSFDGIAPALIQWKEEGHPASSFEEMGCSLVRLEGFHREAETIAGLLKSIGFEGNFWVYPLPSHTRPYLVAHIRTSNGTLRIPTL